MICLEYPIPEIPDDSENKSGMDRVLPKFIGSGRVSGTRQSLVKAFNRKVQGVAEACQEQGLVFLPVALETLGGFHKVAVEQVKKIGAAVARHQGSDERVATRQLFQRLSLTLMRGNAALILGRRPDSDFVASEIDGIF